MIAPVSKVRFGHHPVTVLGFFELLTNVSLEALAGPEKTQPITRIRHEAMWILRQLTSQPFAAIGQHFGGRDYATVQVGVNNVADRMAADIDYRDRIVFLLTEIANACGPVTPRADISLAAARGILADPMLSDADARTAALHMLAEVRHGA